MADPFKVVRRHPLPIALISWPRRRAQQDVEHVVDRASQRILRFLQRRGVITLVTAPGDDEVTVVTDDTMAEKDPLLADVMAWY